MNTRNKIIVTGAVCTVAVLGLVLTGCMAPRRAQIYPHADSTVASPVYVLLVSKGGIMKKDIMFWPSLYEEYFRLAGKRPVYSTGEFTRLHKRGRSEPEGKIIVQWTNRQVTVDTSGIHLYDGDYAEVVISPEASGNERK